MTETQDQNINTPQDTHQQPTVGRGEDDRRSEVNPANDPAPRSPAPDEEAVRKGQDNLDSVTTG